MPITVLHLDKDRATRDERINISVDADADAARQAFLAGKYVEVAKVTTSNLNRAFALTQNVDSSWSLDPACHALVDPLNLREDGLGHASTSIGDLMIDNEGVTHFVDRHGFKVLG